MSAALRGFELTFREIALRAAHKQRQRNRLRFLAGEYDFHTMQRKAVRMGVMRDRREWQAGRADAMTRDPSLGTCPHTGLVCVARCTRSPCAGFNTPLNEWHNPAK